jgi:hypothetical protein
MGEGISSKVLLTFCGRNEWSSGFQLHHLLLSLTGITLFFNFLKTEN